MTTPRQKLIESLESGDFRHAYVSEHLHQGFAFQVKAARQGQGLTQEKLADMADMKQSRISQIEDPNYEGLSLSTAKRIASALDIALIFKAVSFSKFADFLVGSTSISMGDWMEPIPRFDEDAGLTRATPEVTATQGIRVPAVAMTASVIKMERVVTPGSNIVYTGDYTRNRSVSPPRETAPLSAADWGNAWLRNESNVSSGNLTSRCPT